MNVEQSTSTTGIINSGTFQITFDNGAGSSYVLVPVEESADSGERVRQPWQGILAIEGSPTSDGRYLLPGEIAERDLPLPIAASHDDQQATETVGRIETVERIPASEFDHEGFDLPADLPPQAVVIWGEGTFDGSPQADDALRQLENGVGISLDLTTERMALVSADTYEEVDPADVFEEGDLLGMLFGGVPEGYLQGIAGKIGGASLASIPAFEETTIKIVEDAAVVASGFAIHVEPFVLTASGAGRAPLTPPKAWFEMPETDLPCPLTVTDEGQVYGHLALWGQCHAGFRDVCQTPPRSYSDYKFFHLGLIDTAEGERVPVGKITVGTGHAPISYGSVKTQEHYDNTGCVAAFVRATDGKRGIWLSGAIRSDLPAEKIRDLQANPPSGDWRAENGMLELQGVLAVPVPGFPVPRQEARLVASGAEEEVEALVATGYFGSKKHRRKKAMLDARLREALSDS